MISIQQATKTVISKHSFLEDLLSSEMANHSSLARKIKPDIEKILQKEVTEHSIIMSLKRLETESKKRFNYKDAFAKVPEITVRSNLIVVSVRNSDSFGGKVFELFYLDQKEKKSFFILVEGTSETTIIANSVIFHKLKSILEWEHILLYIPNASSITIALTEEVIKSPGIFSQFLKSLSSNGINILQVSSTYLEFTIIVRYEDADKAFSLIKSLFN